MSSGPFLAVQKVKVSRKNGSSSASRPNSPQEQLAMMDDDVPSPRAILGDGKARQKNGNRDNQTPHIKSRNLGDILRTVDDKNKKQSRDVEIPWKIRTQPIKYRNIPKRYGSKPVLYAEMEDRALDEQKVGLQSVGSRLRTFKMGVPQWLKSSKYMEEYAQKAILADREQYAAEMQQSNTMTFICAAPGKPGDFEESPDASPIAAAIAPLTPKIPTAMVAVVSDADTKGSAKADDNMRGEDMRSYTDSISFAEEYIKILDESARSNTPHGRNNEATIPSGAPGTPHGQPRRHSKVAPSLSLSSLLDGDGILSIASMEGSHSTHKRHRKRSGAVMRRMDRKQNGPREVDVKPDGESSIDNYYLLDPPPTSAHASIVENERPMYTPDAKLREHRERHKDDDDGLIYVQDTNVPSPGGSVVGNDSVAGKHVRAKSFRASEKGHLPDFDAFFNGVRSKGGGAPTVALTDKDPSYLDKSGNIRTYHESHDPREWNATKETMDILMQYQGGSSVSSMDHSMTSSEGQGYSLDTLHLQGAIDEIVQTRPMALGVRKEKRSLIAQVAGASRRMATIKRNETLQGIRAREAELKTMYTDSKNRNPVLRVHTAPMFVTERRPPPNSRQASTANVREVATALEAGPDLVSAEAHGGLSMPLSDILDEVGATVSVEKVSVTAVAVEGEKQSKNGSDPETKGEEAQAKPSTRISKEFINREPLDGILYEYYPDYSDPKSGSQEAVAHVVSRKTEVHGGVPVCVLHKPEDDH